MPANHVLDLAQHQPAEHTQRAQQDRESTDEDSPLMECAIRLVEPGTVQHNASTEEH